MSLTMYQASVPVFSRVLAAMSAILDKAVAHAEVRKLEPQALLQFRLYPDMFPFVRQIQSVSDQAKGGTARLAGVEVPKFTDTETSFGELKVRLAKTLEFVGAVRPAQIDGSEERQVVLTFPTRTLTFTGRDYLFGFVLPNLYFHATTAYDILRHNGVDIGKRDFLGG
jgi:hypothetical protein